MWPRFYWIVFVPSCLIIFVPLAVYWQNVSATQAVTIFTSRDVENGALCNGPNIPAGVNIDQYLSQYAIPSRGFPFQIQAGGTCVPPDNGLAIAADIAAAALVSLATAAAIIASAKYVLQRVGHGRR